MKMVRYSIFLFVIIFIFSTISIMAQNEVDVGVGDSVLVSIIKGNNSLKEGDNLSDENIATNMPDELPEETKCENFEWIQKYIKDQLNNKTLTPDRLQIIYLLEGANYGLQDELKLCEKDLKKSTINRYGSYFLLIIVFVLLIILTKNHIKRRKEYG